MRVRVRVGVERLGLRFGLTLTRLGKLMGLTSLWRYMLWVRVRVEG